MSSPADCRMSSKALDCSSPDRRMSKAMECSPASCRMSSKATDCSPTDCRIASKATGCSPADCRMSSKATSARGESKVVCVICQDEFGLGECSEVRACGHRFCTPCIYNWAQSCSQCPLCKSEMGALGPAFRARIANDSDRHPQEEAVPRRRLKVWQSDEDDLFGFADMDEDDEHCVCEICHLGNNPAQLLLCDTCDAGYHTYCLSPSLPAVPSGSWHCSRCLPWRRRQRATVGRPPGYASFLGPGAAAVGWNGADSTSDSDDIEIAQSAGTISVVDDEDSDELEGISEVISTAVAGAATSATDEVDVAAAEPIVPCINLTSEYKPTVLKRPTTAPAQVECVIVPEGGFRRLRRLRQL
eukprot:gnl/TRDRNA2_/TRDRNA2_205179_c0_seq1.p1 gnl/TRDRNA2_/TRDRNA2_205179_c0~~gnl/TRDRNA2_/TRDRNA2_205179_c0_seq1.p1  ORF type:complete len:358 (-),score=43.37 gnl/TRDRNA2_/TRDRNA2_205179_c0_seq1:31-1104(-)